MRRFGWLLAAFVVTLCGLVRVDYVHCSSIDPGWPAYRSDYIETRGFLFGWLITGDNLCAASLAWWRRVLPVQFMIAFLSSLALVLPAWAALRIFGRARRARNPAHPPSRV